MAFDREPPSEQEIERWFLTNPVVPPQTFEFALVLGGTVSAGAYTAGAVDFLIEALDAWTQRRDHGDAHRAVPHRRQQPARLCHGQPRRPADRPVRRQGRAWPRRPDQLSEHTGRRGERIHAADAL